MRSLLSLTVFFLAVGICLSFKSSISMRSFRSLKALARHDFSSLISSSRSMQLHFSEQDSDDSTEVESKANASVEEEQTDDAEEAATEEEDGDVAGEQEAAEPDAGVDELDPVVLATQAYEKKLAGQLASLESTLKSERVNLLRQKDKLSESGKNGFFMVQAQVNEFGKKKVKEQQMRVERSKREFVEKMLPVLDEFRNATLAVPPDTEKEATMHKSFESLLGNVLAVFEKYGYSEYSAEEGSKLDQLAHEIVYVVEQEGTDPNTVLKSVRPGLKSSEGSVVRKAQVVVSVKPSDESGDNDSATSSATEE